MKQNKDAIEAIYKELQKKRRHADITDLSVEINSIVNEHIEMEEHQFEEAKIFDISAIDFDLLRHEFAKSEEKNLIMKDIQELLQERIAQMLAANPLRINFYEKYQEIIHDYNKEQNRATMDHPFDKQETKAALLVSIRDLLWAELPDSYPDESINHYQDAIFNYVYQQYGSVA